MYSRRNYIYANLALHEQIGQDTIRSGILSENTVAENCIWETGNILIISHFLIYNIGIRRWAMKYLTSLQTAEKWGLTKRRVNSLCQEGSIPGAYKEGYRWMIPENAERPDAARKAAAGYGESVVRQWMVRETDNTEWEVGNVGGINRMALPIGISDFRLAVSRYYYVDKTLLIKDLLDYRPMVSLFTRPRRFGGRDPENQRGGGI